MKIKIGDKVYLQLIDLYFIRMHELYPGGDFYVNCKEVFPDTKVNPYGFSYVFDDPAVVNWIMSQEYIIDYDVCLEYHYLEIALLYAEYEQYYDSLTQEYLDANPDNYIGDTSKESLLMAMRDYQLYQLELILQYRDEDIDIDFPPEYRPFAGSLALS